MGRWNNTFKATMGEITLLNSVMRVDAATLNFSKGECLSNWRTLWEGSRFVAVNDYGLGGAEEFGALSPGC